MRRLPLISAALALCCFAATPVFAQGDGAWQQAERDRQYQPPCQDRRGAGPDQSLTVGSNLPQALRSNQTVVNDWRAHNLSDPTWRAHWVQVGADYVLVEYLTNRIRAVRLNGC